MARSAGRQDKVSIREQGGDEEEGKKGGGGRGREDWKVCNNRINVDLSRDQN